jgi:branched-chain amino acid transport system permease protein
MAAAARARPLAVGPLLVEAAATAVIVFLLTALLVGIRTEDQGGKLGFQTDFTAVGLICALAFLGRAGIVLLRERRSLPVLAGALAMGIGAWFLPPMIGVAWNSTPMLVLTLATAAFLALKALFQMRRDASTVSAEARAAGMDRVAAGMQHATRYVGPILVVIAIIVPFTGIPFTDLEGRKLLGILTFILLYVMLGWGLNIIVGLAGLLDLGYVAFYAVGAYSYALLATTFGWSFWVCLPLAGVLAAFFGIILGYPVLRLRGDYFAIVTLGFGEIVRIVLNNWSPVTNGPNGINNIPRPSFFGYVFERNPAENETAFHQLLGIAYDPIHRFIFLYFLILVLALIVNLVSQRLRRLPIGRAWEALREDDVACQSLGLNRTTLKLAAFATSATFGGFAGSFFASYQGFINPESFTFIESAIILAIVVLGGMGNQLGIVVAAFLIIGLPEFFRDLDLYRMLVFGLCMVGIMVWRPRGLLAHRDATILLHGRGGGA